MAVSSPKAIPPPSARIPTSSAPTSAPAPRVADPLLRVEGVRAVYGPVEALRGIDLEVRVGELVCLIGANGAGKTSTLRAISGLLRPRGGRILFADREIHRLEPAAILALGIAHCPEGRRIFPYLTVHENLEMGAYVRRDRRAVREDAERVCTHF